MHVTWWKLVLGRNISCHPDVLPASHCSREDAADSSGRAESGENKLLHLSDNSAKILALYKKNI